MQRILLPFIGLMLSSLTASAQLRILSGTPIGSPSVDYSSGSVSTTVNQPADAFDNDYSTFYASYNRSYTWVGLDLGTKHVIKRIMYSPRKGWGNRMVLGIFEGANQPDFSDAIPIHIIKKAPTEGVMSTTPVNCSRGFRYVRYVGPEDARCNVSELRFYGTEGEGDDSQLYQLTNLPVVVIHTQDAKQVTSRSTYVDGWISVISEDGRGFFTDTLQIRGRGNGSWEVSNNLAYGGTIWHKRPYRLKLAHKARMLDMPAKDKNWVLINNLGDKTLIRNLVAFEASRRFDMKYTPAGRLVDVILNGEYQGNYQLCDKIEVGTNRVEITKMTNTDNRSPEVTGGYLIEIDAYANSEPVHFTSTYGNPINVKYPKHDDITTSQLNYLRNAFNNMETKLYASYYTNPTTGYASVLDVDAFLKNFLIGEFSGNTDTYWSTYMSKDRGTNEKFTCCAVWDFDLAFENDGRTYPINGNSNYMSLSNKSSAAGNMKSFVGRVVNSQTERIKELYNYARNYRGFTPEVMEAYVDSLAKVINQSQELNFMRWPILNIRVQQNFQALGSYQAEVDFMKKYIRERFAWLDNKIGYEPMIDGIHNAMTQMAGSILSGEGQIQLVGFTAGCRYQIFTLDGKLLMQNEVTPGTCDIDVRPGFYIVKVSGSQGQKRQQKLLVK
ncbi:MAG: CotH kinase family protein [Bacteroidaceae bacterium]|nr:CotH kinase family protein [Bacteroidaceae bacterium]